MWRNITSSSENDTLAITCRMKIGSASLMLTHMRRTTSSPMSPELSASERPKCSVNSDTERSQKMVSVSLSAPCFVSFRYSGLS